MKEKEIIKRLINQLIYIDNDNIKRVDYCGNCDRIVTQTEINGSYCCEYCHSENINILEVE